MAAREGVEPAREGGQGYPRSARRARDRLADPGERARDPRGAALARAGITAHPQYEIRDGSTFVARVDFALPDLRIAIEADGYRWHAGRARWERDLARRNALVALGWHVVHVTARDVNDPTKVINAVRAATTLRRTKP